MDERKQKKLKPLLDRVPPGFLVESGWLRDQNIARSSIHDYAQNGWLETVTRGLYRRPFMADASEAVRQGWLIPVLSMQHLLGYAMHLGGPSALREHGHIHYLRARGKEKIYLYGETPSWLNRLPVNAEFVSRSRKLFGDGETGVENAHHVDSPNTASTQNLLFVPQSWQLKISTPERAILETLDELPDGESFHNIDMVFEGLSNLRPRLLTQCLNLCRSVKVKRLFFVYADKHNHAWLKHIDKSAFDLGSGPRALAKGGRLHPLYRIYVPEELLPTRAEESADV